MMMTQIESPLGKLRAVAEEGALIGLYLPGQDLPQGSETPDAASNDVLAETAAQLAQYFAGERDTFSLPLNASGTSFQRNVWAALREIPFGETRSYGQVARAIDKPTASRAVGAANGQNPISIIVPCHRVVGSNGKLTGYAGGLAVKRWLLRHEAGE